MNNVCQTIISQYQNSPTMRRLIENQNEAIDPTADIQNFYDFVLNLDIAKVRTRHLGPRGGYSTAMHSCLSMI